MSSQICWRALHMGERAFDGIAGVRLAEQIQPDFVLVNLALPMHSGLDVLNRLNKLHWTLEISITDRQHIRIGSAAH